MNWTETLRSEMESAYRAAEGLVKLVEPSQMAWRPATGSNWMTVGQLLEHMATACGGGCKGFVTGDWGMPADAVAEMPTADKLPAAKSAADALEKLAADKKVALEMLARAGEKDLAGKRMAAPWDPTERLLGQHLLQMVNHLVQHKGQLFYYLKLLGKPVHTGHLWGM